MIMWLAEGALLSAIVDELDMGFSCLLKPISVVFVSSIIRLFSIGPFGICEKWAPGSPGPRQFGRALRRLSRGLGNSARARRALRHPSRWTIGDGREPHLRLRVWR